MDIRKGETLSSDDVRSASDGRTIPLDALDIPPPELDIEPVPAMGGTAFDLEKFMEEKVTIHIPMSAVEGDLQFVEPKVNGVSAVIPRNRNVIVKRKFVEVLLRAKRSDYTQQVNAQDAANIRTELEESVALAVPVNIIHDTPRGLKWAMAILQSPA